MNKNKIIFFQPAYFSQSLVAGAYPGSMRHTIHHTYHTQTGTMWTYQFTSCMHLWGVKRNHSPRRKPMQIWGEHANSKNMVALSGN